MKVLYIHEKNSLEQINASIHHYTLFFLRNNRKNQCFSTRYLTGVYTDSYEQYSNPKWITAAYNEFVTHKSSNRQRQ